jgi:hypothetical protein
MASLSELFQSLSDRFLQASTGAGKEEALPVFQNRHTRTYGFVSPRRQGVMANYFDELEPGAKIKDNLRRGPVRDLPTLRGLTSLASDLERSGEKGAIFVDPSAQTNSDVINHEAVHALFDKSGLDNSALGDTLYNSIPPHTRAELSARYSGRRSRIADEAAAYALGSPIEADRNYLGVVKEGMDIKNPPLAALFDKLDKYQRSYYERERARMLSSK